MGSCTGQEKKIKIVREEEETASNSDKRETFRKFTKIKEITSPNNKLSR